MGGSRENGNRDADGVRSAGHDGQELADAGKDEDADGEHELRDESKGENAPTIALRQLAAAIEASDGPKAFHHADRDSDEILERIYAGYPDLRPRPPPQEEPEISSPLRWANVTLPASVTEADLDKIIFSMLRPRLMKTARIVGDVVVECKRLSWPVTPEIVGARIEELADEDRIDSEGDLRYWRHSEIRLKPEDTN